ncbi:MFS transporter [Halobacteriales archaeon QS_3_64_16]|nr:MAG: MFS transporter [Halobacteriales archaeon QS_3_64_16]
MDRTALSSSDSGNRWLPRYTILALCVGAYFAIRFSQLLVSALVPSILGTFAVSRAAIGTVLGGMWAAYALAQLPSGVLGDRFGPRSIVLAGVGLTAVAGLLLAGTPSFVLFGVSVLLLGVGAGLYYNAATALLTARFDAIGQAIAVHRIGDPRVALGAGVAVSLLVLGAFARRVPAAHSIRTDESLRELLAPRYLLTLISRPTLAYTTVLAVLAEFVGLATMSLLPTFLVQHHGYTLLRAGLLFSVLAAIRGVLQPLAGRASDRLGRDGVLALMMGAGVIGYGTLSSSTAFVLAVPAVVLAGIAMSWAPPLQSRAIDGLTESEQGAGFGLVRTIYILSGALGTAVIGLVADVAGWATSFLVLTALLAIAFLLLLSNRAVGRWA